MTKAKVFAADAVSRTGERFLGVVELEGTGELSVLTRGTHGWASAHMSIARKALGRPVVRVMHTGYESSAGEQMILTTWEIKRGHAQP
ncbi:hypothetical protein ACFVVM_12415 [Nocardia sp. NPDC058176]|uniref:hypothetical protein n=1 Tax=Nocardia sp. NPDC058176 TaxID=3346368 RepID=UPI0036DB07C4